MAKARAGERKTASPITITYPQDGATVSGQEFAATGAAPTTIASVVGALARKDDSTKSVDGAPLLPPSPWSIAFSKENVNKLFKTGETKLEVVLTVKDKSGAASPQTSTFTIDRGSGHAAKDASLTADRTHLHPFSATKITPDPPLSGSTVTCPFTSTGEAPPGPLYAFIARPGGSPILGSMIQMAQDPSDEFVFLWQNIPPGTGYAIYYQTWGNPPLYATDGPITVI